MATRKAAEGLSSGLLYATGVMIIFGGVVTLVYQAAGLVQYGVWQNFELATLWNWFGDMTGDVRGYGASPVTSWFLHWPLSLGLMASGGLGLWMGRVARELQL
jgi:hypothetical protein